jgi:glycoside hydrolase-like protein
MSHNFDLIVTSRSRAGRGTFRFLCVKFLACALRTAALFLVTLLITNCARAPQSAEPRFYLGFDRNIYPGDAALPALRKTLAFSSYWLSPPPGEKINTWAGKRELLRSQGFGFLVLYRGPDSRELKTQAAAKSKGFRDGENAVALAKKEGFSAGAVIFVDIEEGGRLPDTYHTYLAAWAEALTRAGYRTGVYCSGMPVKEEPQATIATADDIRNHAGSRDIVIWAYNDACPPSPGCIFPHDPPSPAKSGVSYAAVWQFAQSPRRKEFTSRCAATYHRDGNCYAPGDSAHAWFLDVNSATSPDPSGGAK